MVVFWLRYHQWSVATNKTCRGWLRLCLFFVKRSSWSLMSAPHRPLALKTVCFSKDNSLKKTSTHHLLGAELDHSLPTSSKLIISIRYLKKSLANNSPLLFSPHLSLSSPTTSLPAAADHLTRRLPPYRCHLLRRLPPYRRHLLRLPNQVH